MRKQAERKKVAQNPFSRPPRKMTDVVELKHLLLHNLHPIVAHEQGIALKTAAGVRMLTHPAAMPYSSTWSSPCVSVRVGA